jgi:3-methylfumaryl-CoA hydratase
MSLDVAHLKEWIGRSMVAEDVATPRLVAEYRATLDPHLAPVPPQAAPLAFHWCLAPAIAPMAELGPDGHPARGGFLPPVPLPRRMWAGGEIEIDAGIEIGATVTRRSTIADVSVKEGRSGTLCFVTVRHDYATATGVAITERQDIVYRDAEPPSAAPAPAPAPAAPRPAELTWQVEGSPVLLFRYSALTFNGHRIHYDQPYVTGVEGYRGLLVHGPLQASLLLNLAAVWGGRAPTRFRYRGLSPLTAGATFSVAGTPQPDGGVTVWTQSADGRVCMEGQAVF